ncbi:hypothetical protein [Streptomyces sp. NPDC055140]
MIVPLSAVVLFGVLTAVLLRSRYVGPLAAIAVFLFGCFVADTGASGAVLRALIDAAHNIS